MRVRYLHSDIDTLERIEILRELRLGTYDVLVGINLLREGLDLPEVSLVAILDESHQTIPQLQAMYRGDRSRKETLVEFGFRLPSALDNRPLNFEEF